MRTTLAAFLFCLTVAGVGARPDDGPKAWDWPKDRSAMDGPMRMEVGHLTGEADTPEWELGLLVTTGKTGVGGVVSSSRFVGVKVADDNGNTIPFKQFPQTPHNLSFTRRPDAKANTVVIQFGPHPDRSGLTMTISAATVRGLSAKTSYYRKPNP